MKTINEMFPSKLNVADMLLEAGITVPSGFRFSDTNIVIGKNGAGKTRFLRALKLMYSSEDMADKVDLLYGYFPGLSDRPVQGYEELPEHELLEFLDQPDVRFDDFFKEIEMQSTDFLARLLDYHSQRRKKANSKILEKINIFFLPITGKMLVMPVDQPSEEPLPVVHGPDVSVTVAAMPHRFYVSESDGKITKLDVAMERFSPGERLLLYMSIFFALRRENSREQVVILDEPETHLHPQALLEFIRTLKNAFPHATVWIATHSLFLLPEFRFENVVYMENGAVIPRGSKLYEGVLTALLGKDSEGVRRFFSSLPHWQYVEFVTECFTDPKVISTVDPEDEQVRMFKKALEGQKIRRILDCGGGSGRLGLSLEAAGFPLETYEIFDKDPACKDGKFTAYANIADINGPYDCVVMMNFLHEVDPDEWTALFLNLCGFLNPGGSILFVEVNALKDGERPNETGYMLLGKTELAVLFDAEQDFFPEIRIRANQKSLGILIPCRLLINISKRSVAAAIRVLEERIYEELKQIRSDWAKWKEDGIGQPPNARRYAFLSQQYINAKLYNERTLPNRPQYTSYALMSKSERLSLMLRTAQELVRKDPSIDRESSGNIRSTLKSTVDFYKKSGHVSSIQLARCVNFIHTLEHIGARKETVHACLSLLAMMGVKDAIVQLSDEGIDPISFLVEHQAVKRAGK